MTEELINIPRLYTGIAEWLFCVTYIILAKRRIDGWRFYALVIEFLGAIVGFQILAGTFPLYLWVVAMVFAIFLMFAFIWTTSNVNAITAGYQVVLAFVAAEFAASVHWQIYYFIINMYQTDMPVVSDILLVVVYGGIFAILMVLESRYMKKELIGDVKRNDLLSFVVIGTIIFFISNISFISVNTPLSGRYPAEIFYIRTLVDFAGIIVLYSNREHKLYTNSMIDLHQMENLLKKQYEQYSMSQESIDIINQKYHDLKNQIMIIRQEKDFNKREEFLKTLEEGIKRYEAQYKTGNQVLDTLLASKSMVCLDHKINFTAIADGQLLEFISTMDLCSIFGNAIDNAIESVIKIPDTEQRIIKFSTFSQNDFIIMNFENYYVNTLAYNNGNLITTKMNTRFHGYGLKSIRSAVEKYNGSVSINTDSHWFKLTILLPKPSN